MRGEPGRNCLSCNIPVSTGSASGFCRRCFNQRIGRDPAVAARKSASLKRYALQPGVKAARAERGRQAALKRLADPVYAAALSDFMRNVVQPLSVTPEQLARDYRKEAGRKGAATRLAWCPPEYRDTYRHLIRTGIKKAEAVPMIMETIAADKRRRTTDLSPFERQEAALEAALRRGETNVLQDNVFRRRAA